MTKKPNIMIKTRQMQGALKVELLYFIKSNKYEQLFTFIKTIVKV